MSRLGVIEAELEDICEECGDAKELRPYGNGGKRICFSCAMNDEDEARRQFEYRVCGDLDTPEIQ